MSTASNDQPTSSPLWQGVIQTAETSSLIVIRADDSGASHRFAHVSPRAHARARPAALVSDTHKLTSLLNLMVAQ